MRQWCECHRAKRRAMECTVALTRAHNVATNRDKDEDDEWVECELMDSIN